MEVLLLRTKGLGQLASVEVAGEMLIVQDGFSSRTGPHSPGIVLGASFGYVSFAGTSWPDAVAGNRAHKRQLVKVRGCAYEGFGRIVSVMPVMIDFGLLTMQDGNWSGDESLVGSFVRIEIDRLEMSIKPELVQDDSRAARR